MVLPGRHLGLEADSEETKPGTREGKASHAVLGTGTWVWEGDMARLSVCQLWQAE
jgi:hypothetical protein